MIDPENSLVEKTKTKTKFQKLLIQKNSTRNHRIITLTHILIWLKKIFDIQTKAKAQIENTNNLLLLAKKSISQLKKIL